MSVGSAQSRIERDAFDRWYGQGDRRATRSIENNINTMEDQSLREQYKTALSNIANSYLASPWKSPVPVVSQQGKVSQGPNISFNPTSDVPNSIGTMILLREQALGIKNPQAKQDIVGALAGKIGVSKRAVLDYISGDKVVHGALPVIVGTAVAVGLFAKLDGMSTDSAIKYGGATALATIGAIEGSSFLVNGEGVNIVNLLSLPSIKGFK